MITVSLSGIDDNDVRLEKLEACIRARKNNGVEVAFNFYPVDAISVSVQIKDRANIICRPEVLLEQIKDIVDDIATPYRSASCSVGNCSSNFCSWSKNGINKPPSDSTDALLTKLG